MVNSYKHFKKHNELFWGLGFFTLIKLGVLTLLIIYASSSLKLSLNSPLFIFLTILWMIITAFLIKAAQGDEVQGHYTSIMTHPFLNHIYPLEANPDGYTTVEELQNIKELCSDHILSKENDLVSILKLNNGISLNRLDDKDQTTILDIWKSFLAGLKSVSVFDSYWLETNGIEDSVQLFIWVKPYASPQKPQQYLSELASKHYNWFQEHISSTKFIPDPEFYIIIRHKNSELKNNIICKIISAIYPKLLQYIQITKHNDNDYKLLKHKIENCQKVLKSLEINSQLLENETLKEFSDSWTQYLLEDKAKYLQITKPETKELRFSKTYRMSALPDSGELNFWINHYLLNLESEASISIELSPRDALQDRRKAELKTQLLKELNRNIKSSTLSLIQENNKIAEDLIFQPYSFDLSIFITVFAESTEKLQDLDIKLKRPIKNSRLASLDRQQINNYIYALPFAYNSLSNKEKLFTNLDLAGACFPFIKNSLGTKTGPLMGIDLETQRPVFLNEYDQSEFNNRGINFIGDSGSGKTVSAKLAIKRRLESESFQIGSKSFYIVDNTEDGWKFFVESFGGHVVHLDQFEGLNDQVSWFTPLHIQNHKNKLNDHIERMIFLLSLTQGSEKISTYEKNFLSTSLQKLYEQTNKPSLSDLYELWSSSENSELKYKWQAALSPYTYKTNGIYAKLMDGKEAHFTHDSRLILFTFSKLDRDSHFLPISLYLINNFIAQKLIFEKQTGITLVVDEAWKIFTGKDSEKGKELLTHLARAGRGLDLGLWTISQKPSDLPREIHSSASLSLSFQLKESKDRDEMALAANLNHRETKLLNMHETGIALLKSTKASGLIKMIMDPYEAVITNSTRDFVNKRNQVYERFLEELVDPNLNPLELRSQAALQTIKELARGQMA